MLKHFLELSWNMGGRVPFISLTPWVVPKSLAFILSEYHSTEQCTIRSLCKEDPDIVNDTLMEAYVTYLCKCSICIDMWLKYKWFCQYATNLITVTGKMIKTKLLRHIKKQEIAKRSDNVNQGIYLIFNQIKIYQCKKNLAKWDHRYAPE